MELRYFHAVTQLNGCNCLIGEYIKTHRQHRQVYLAKDKLDMPALNVVFHLTLLFLPTLDWNSKSKFILETILTQPDLKEKEG